MTSLTFYGGVNEIGGNKILLNDGDTRIWLDFGMSFSQSNMYFAEFLQPKKFNGIIDFLEMGLLPSLPDMSGFYRQDYLAHTQTQTQPNAAYDAVLLSHAHADHSAYIHFLRQDIPIYASEVTKRILASMEDTSTGGFSEFINFKETFKMKTSSRATTGVVRVSDKERSEAKVPRDFHGLANNEQVSVGDITIEALPVNHSIPGAMGFLIHTSRGTIAYTGDVRFHGYGGELTRAFVKRAAAANPIALICEGTRIDQTESLTELDVQKGLAKAVNKTKNLVIANYPWKDLERLRSFYEVARATGRKLALNLKQAYLLKNLEATCDSGLSLDDDHICIYIDKKKWGMINRPGCPHNIVEQDYSGWEREFLNYPNRVTCDDIHRHQSDFIVRIDFFDLTDLINIRPSQGSCYIRSVTEPFDEEGEIELKRVENWLKHFGLYPYEQVHASGHASGPEITRLIDDINPKAVFPVHTEHPELFIAPQGTKVEMPEVGKRYTI